MPGCRWILLILLIVSCLGGAAEEEDETEKLLRLERHTHNHSYSYADVATARTLNIIAKKTERGRLVLLLCPRNCPIEKKAVPDWVFNFNAQAGYSVQERIAYHYHIVRKPLPFMNETGPVTEPTIAFLIGKEIYFFPGPITDQKSLVDWLEELDQDDVIIPKTHDELDGYLNTANCSDKFLLYTARDSCQIPQWRSIARIVRLKLRVRTIFVRRPIRDHQMATVLFKRLPQLSELDCMVMTFLQLRTYSYPLTVVTPAQMVEHISSLLTPDECIMLDDGYSYPISGPLSDLQMEYFTGERKLFHLEQSTVYLVVGATSGVAVVALAISIFWGLNGNAFAQSK